jgi:hypothetical protein
MKKTLIYLVLAAIILPGCTKNFDDINTDPLQVGASVFDPNYLLSSSQYLVANQSYYNTFLFESMWTQTLASTSTVTSNYLSNGDKYVPSSNTLDYQGRFWNLGYGSSDEFGTGAASLAVEMYNLTKGKEEYTNLNAVSIIMKVMIMQQITDVYGDVPYTQALQAKTNNITQPVYDTQQSIYTNMLTELETAITQLDASKKAPTADLFYKGDITKWKKLGYSLMLKLAMRLTKVDAATAQKYAEKAFAGGTFSSIADNAIVKGDNSTGFATPASKALNVDVYETRWSKTLIDYLKANSDPRLSIVAEVPADGLKANQTTGAGNTSAAVQIGLPNGYDLKGGATDITKEPNYPGSTGSGADVTPIGKYSRPRTSLYCNRNGASFILTYAESELLLAEAAVRGWNTGDKSTHYKNAVSAALQSLVSFGSDGAISATVADAYALAHPLDITSTTNSLKQINEQLWATNSTFFNFVETWINWKRSGYPVLTPVNYTGNFSGGVIPRRHPYPVTEGSLNGKNYQDAVSRLSGGDNWSSRVWWDK